MSNKSKKIKQIKDKSINKNKMNINNNNLNQNNINLEILLSCDSDIKLINGSAGTRKTELLIEFVIDKITKNQNYNILILSLVGSVCDEIKNRIENKINKKFEKISMSNHFILNHNSNMIEITNFDAWVNYELIKRNVHNLNKISTMYDMKVEILNELIKDNKPVQFNIFSNNTANCILIDEVQDFDPLRINLLLNYVNKIKYIQNDQLSLLVFGDFLQTIFEKSIQPYSSHPINQFNRIPHKKIYLTQNYRSPLGHINFLNKITEDIRCNYCLPDITTTNTDKINKPFLFSHPYMSTNSSAQIVALQTCLIINILLENKLVKPKDIAIFMRKSSDQMVFEQLKLNLTNLYLKFGYNNKIIHFQSQTNKYESTDWSKSKNKTILSSIHAMKGKERKVIFFLGLSRGSIPSTDYYNHSFNDKLIYDSLLNVGLSRSTKYLFVGFTKEEPSYYLSKMHNDTNLEDYAYLSWKHENIKHSPYDQIATELYNFWLCLQKNKYPNFEIKLRNEILDIPTKAIYSIKTDLSTKYTDYKKLFGINDTNLMYKFGNKIKFNCMLNDDLYTIIGIMGELILLKHLDPYLIKSYFHLYITNKVYFTDDEELLNMVVDLNLNNLESYDEWNKNYFIIKNRFNLDNLIPNHKFNNKFFILSKAMETNSFKSSINNVIINNNIKDIKPIDFWNCSLLWNELKQTVRKPHLYLFIDYFNEDLSMLYENIENYTKKINKDAMFSYDEKHYLLNTITNKDILQSLNFIDTETFDKDIYQNGYTYGIYGKSDLYDVNSSTIIEIKTSHCNYIKPEWITQALLYYLLENKVGVIKKVRLVNLLQGIEYVYDESFLEQINKKDILIKLLTDLKFNSKLVELLLNNFE